MGFLPVFGERWQFPVLAARPRFHKGGSCDAEPFTSISTDLKRVNQLSPNTGSGKDEIKKEEAREGAIAVIDAKSQTNDPER